MTEVESYFKNQFCELSPNDKYNQLQLLISVKHISPLQNHRQLRKSLYEE